MKAFSTIFKAGQKPSVIPALKAMYPALRFLVRIGIVTSPFYHLIYIGLQPEPNEAVRIKAAAVMNRIGTGLLKQSKGNKTSHRKDILSLLAQANTMEEKAYQMKDEDVMSRAYKFILDWYCLLIHSQRSLLSSLLVMKQRGTYVHPSDILQLKLTISESCRSATMSWALYALSQNKHAQTKLREEISNMPTDNPTMDDLNGLPYMDAIVRETLRFYSPVAGIQREAGKDDCIPLSKPFTDKKGIVRNEIR